MKRNRIIVIVDENELTWESLGFLNNCASHSRYFSDELGALFFKKQAEQMFVFSLCIWYNKNMDKNMFNINNNEFSYGR